MEEPPSFSDALSVLRRCQRRRGAFREPDCFRQICLPVEQLPTALDPLVAVFEGSVGRRYGSDLVIESLRVIQVKTRLSALHQCKTADLIDPHHVSDRNQLFSPTQGLLRSPGRPVGERNEAES